jgi:hypothetical protein
LKRKKRSGRKEGEEGRKEKLLVQRPVMASVPSRSWMASAAIERRGDGKLETMTWVEREMDGGLVEGERG